MRPRDEVVLTLRDSDLGCLRAALQRGVGVRATAGSAVLSFLTDDVGLAPEYVRQRITTVFLDGDVVDSLEAATLRDGSVLALSAAMPGLVGATLRRSGPYAAMRAEITRKAERVLVDRPGENVGIRVKLFNLLVEEIGPLLLERGVLLDREAMDEIGPAARGAGVDLPGSGVEVRVLFRRAD